MKSLDKILTSFLVAGCYYEYSFGEKATTEYFGIGEDSGIINAQDSESIQDTQIQEDTGEALDYCLWIDSFVQRQEFDGTDIIWVIDKSGSMLDDEARVVGGIEAMMEALPSNGWQLNMITTDVTGVLQDQLHPLVPGDTVADAQNMYGMITGTSGLEQGLEALMTYVDENPYASTWLRPDVPFLVVFVSDEDDQSFLNLMDAYALAEFENWFDDTFDTRPGKYVASIVHVDPSESSCNTSSLYTGDRYISVTNDYSGIVIDICTKDWSEGVKDVAEQVKQYDTWELQYTPIENSLVVFVDQTPKQQYTQWDYDAATNSVVFLEIPPTDTLVEMAYDIALAPEEECPSENVQTMIKIQKPYLSSVFNYNE